MRRVYFNAIDRLSYRQGCGWLSLFGLPLLAAGVLLLVTAAHSGPMKTRGGAPTGVSDALRLTLFGLPSVAIGIAFIFGRRGIIFDKRAGTVATWWGLLFIPLWTKSFELAAFNAVSLSREKRGMGKRDTYIVFPIRLLDADLGQLNLCAGQNEIKARVLAEEIAKFIGFKLLDSTGGILDVRAAATLGESLRKQVQHSAEEMNLSAPLYGVRSTFMAQGNQVAFKLPSPSFSFCLVAPGLVCVVMFTIFVSSLPGMPLGMWLLIWLPLLIILGALLLQVRRKVTVSAAPAGLRLTTKNILFSKTEEIAGKDLEELRLENQSGKYNLAALSGKKILRFGAGLSREELEWIRQVLLKALTI